MHPLKKVNITPINIDRMFWGKTNEFHIKNFYILFVYVNI